MTLPEHNVTRKEFVDKLIGHWSGIDNFIKFYNSTGEEAHKAYEF